MFKIEIIIFFFFLKNAYYILIFQFIRKLRMNYSSNKKYILEGKENCKIKISK